MEKYDKEMIDDIVKSININIDKLEQAYLSLDAIKYDLSLLIDLIKRIDR